MKAPLHIRIDTDLMDWIRSQSIKENRSITNFVVNILKWQQIKEANLDSKIDIKDEVCKPGCHDWKRNNDRGWFCHKCGAIPINSTQPIFS